MAPGGWTHPGRCGNFLGSRRRRQAQPPFSHYRAPATCRDKSRLHLYGADQAGGKLEGPRPAPTLLDAPLLLSFSLSTSPSPSPSSRHRRLGPGGTQRAEDRVLACVTVSPSPPELQPQKLSLRCLPGAGAGWGRGMRGVELWVPSWALVGRGARSWATLWLQIHPRFKAHQPYRRPSPTVV